MAGDPLLTYGLVSLVTLALVFKWLRPNKSSLKHIPAVGFSTPLLSYYSAIRFLFRGRETVDDGYRKYKGKIFRVRQLSRWLVVVTGHQLIEEMRKAPDDTLSASEAANDFIQAEYTWGANMRHDGYHVPLIRGQLTRSLAVLFPDLRDEVVAAFTDNVPPSDDWIKVPVLKTVMQIICRTSNRVFVGLPLCRVPDYVDLNIGFTIDIITAATVIALFPSFLKPLVAPLFLNVPRSINRGTKHLEPLIRERYAKLEEFGNDWEDKPNDMLAWLMDNAKGEERGVRALVLRVLSVNFAAIQTTSMSFTHALYYLAAHPEYIKPLREEVERAVREEGWTKDAVQKMHKLDSFLKEVQRITGLDSLSLRRKVLKDFTFSDGTFIPAGTTLCAPAKSTHHDGSYYEDPDRFDPWRFSNMRDEDDGDGAKHQMVTTSPEFLPFGHGKHACPGRFFAVNELKTMMAHLVTTYDVKFENEGVLPEPFWFSSTLLPNQTAEVMFRKRRA